MLRRQQEDLAGHALDAPAEAVRAVSLLEEALPDVGAQAGLGPDGSVEIALGGFEVRTLRFVLGCR